MYNKIFRVNGSLQHYDWGGTDFLPALLGVPNPKGRPCAEYWLGAHSKSSSQIILDDGSTKNLDELIQKEPVNFLGEEVAARFGALPYLMKVLDVKDMLSIQVHPSKKAAEERFEKENNNGIPLTSAKRNYKDKNHKPELLSPFGDFYLLHGFKPAEDLHQLLKTVPELNFLVDIFDGSNYRELYTTAMTMPQEQVDGRLKPLLERILPLYNNGSLRRDDEHFWAARAATIFNKNGIVDRGIFSIYFFNVVKMYEGQALFQDAGLPHAYLEGQTMEIMANSDNVLRGGLTAKHIDMEELLGHIHFEPTVPRIIKGKNSNESEEKYITPVRDFQLSRIMLSGGEEMRISTATADIYFVYKGIVEIDSRIDTLPLKPQDELALKNHGRFTLKTGEAMLAIPGAEVHIRAGSDSMIFRATVPSQPLF